MLLVLIDFGDAICWVAVPVLFVCGFGYCVCRFGLLVFCVLVLLIDFGSVVWFNSCFGLLLDILVVRWFVYCFLLVIDWI